MSKSRSLQLCFFHRCIDGTTRRQHCAPCPLHDRLITISRRLGISSILSGSLVVLRCLFLILLLSLAVSDVSISVEDVIDSWLCDLLFVDEGSSLHCTQ